jgi:hypothetical protein
MAGCPVCGGTLPAQRGPRARRYCSRACQAKAYRTRQRQRNIHRVTPEDEERLLAEYDGTPSLELADQLALAARRLAGALNAGLPVDDFDLGVVARIPVVLAARAFHAAPAVHALHGLPDPRRASGPSGVVVDLAARTTGRERSGRAETAAQASRDDREQASGRPARAGRPSAAPDATKTSRDASRNPAEPAPPALKGIEPRPQKLSRKKARAIADAAELVRHPQYRDNHRWILQSGDTVIGYVEPTYGGASRSGRNGWAGRLAGQLGPRCRTRDGAAVDMAERWIRLVTSAP